MSERKAIPERSIPAVLLERILRNGHNSDSELFEFLVSRDPEEQPIMEGYNITYQEIPWDNKEKPLIFGKAACVSPHEVSRRNSYRATFIFKPGKDRDTILSTAYEMGQKIPCLQRVVKPARNGKRKNSRN